MKVILTEKQVNVLSLKESTSKDDMYTLWHFAKSSKGMGFQRKVVFDFLFALQKSGLVNMFESAPWICNGRKWIEAKIVTLHKEPSEFPFILKKANASRDAVIQICMANYDAL